MCCARRCPTYDLRKRKGLHHWPCLVCDDLVAWECCGLPTLRAIHRPCTSPRQQRHNVAICAGWCCGTWYARPTDSIGSNKKELLLCGLHSTLHLRGSAGVAGANAALTVTCVIISGTRYCVCGFLLYSVLRLKQTMARQVCTAAPSESGSCGVWVVKLARTKHRVVWRWVQAPMVLAPLRSSRKASRRRQRCLVLR